MEFRSCLVVDTVEDRLIAWLKEKKLQLRFLSLRVSLGGTAKSRGIFDPARKIPTFYWDSE